MRRKGGSEAAAGGTRSLAIGSCPPEQKRLEPAVAYRGRFRHPKTTLAPVAQLDRAPDYEFGGREFESLRARQQFQVLRLGRSMTFCLPETEIGEHMGNKSGIVGRRRAQTRCHRSQRSSLPCRHAAAASAQRPLPGTRLGGSAKGPIATGRLSERCAGGAGARRQAGSAAYLGPLKLPDRRDARCNSGNSRGLPLAPK